VIRQEAATITIGAVPTGPHMGNYKRENLGSGRRSERYTGIVPGLC
jgi:hypothetical protein